MRRTSFVQPSSLRTRALLRDTILYDDDGTLLIGGEKVYERLLRIYFEYSRYWWCAHWGKQVAPGIHKRRTERTCGTAYMFAAKLYGMKPEKENSVSSFGGESFLLKAVLKDAIKQLSNPMLHELSRIQRVAVAMMLSAFFESFNEAHVKKPMQVEGEPLESILILIARFCEVTGFYDAKVSSSFSRFVGAVQRRAVTLSSSQELYADIEAAIAQSKLTVVAELAYAKMLSNKKSQS